METTGDKIKRLRKSIGLTQEELSEVSGISRAIIQRLENDKFKILPLTFLEAIAPCLKTTVQYLVEELDELAHLQSYVREFIRDPKNTDFIEMCYHLYKSTKGQENSLARAHELLRSQL